MTKVTEYRLNAAERDEITALLDETVLHGQDVELADLMAKATPMSGRLPMGVRKALYRLKLTEEGAGVIIKNSPVSESACGPTPSELPKERRRYATREESLHILYASVLGEPFAWESIQNGNIVNEVLPIKENADKPLSSGSTYTFDLHTEDGFHPHVGDFFGLLCIRNPGSVPTIVACLDDVSLSEKTKDVLFQARFIIGANIAHDVAAVRQMKSVLFGSYDKPYCRLNLNVGGPALDDQEALDAFQEFVAELRRVSQPLVLESGDCVYLDNFRTLHGRPPYAPRFDGADRWFKRLYISAYLRQSRELRSSPEDRLILRSPPSTVPIPGRGNVAPCRSMS